MSVPCFATTAPGLEPFLERELRELGFEGLSRGPSGVAFSADRLGFMRACLALRTAHRVLRTLGTADASSPESLYASVRQLVDWPAMAPPDKTIAVYATARDSVFRDARLAALTVKDAVVDAVRDALGARPNVDTQDPDLLLRVGVKGRHAVVSLDGAGKDSLHARGYRQDAGEAPLRETLAAAMVLASRWDGGTPLVDPVCGAGTLLVEGALWSRGVAPGLLRERFGFERWVGHDPAELEELRMLLRRRIDVARGAIVGRDTDADALAITRENAARAGVADGMDLALGDVAELAPPPGGPGVLLANPPYGHRLGARGDAESLVAALGQSLRERFAGWTACVILPPELVPLLGLPIERSLLTRNGPIDVELVRIRVGAEGRARAAPRRDDRRPAAPRKGGWAGLATGAPPRGGRGPRRGD